MERGGLLSLLVTYISAKSNTEFITLFNQNKEVAKRVSEDLFYESLLQNNKSISKFLLQHFKADEYTPIFMCKDIGMLKWLLLNKIGCQTNVNLTKDYIIKNELFDLGYGIGNYVIINSYNHGKQIKSIIC
jgi:hypothetical protein